MISRLLNGLAAILGAAGFTQFPAFYQQYLQRLGGRLDQSRLDVERLLQDARSAGQTLEEHIKGLVSSGTEEARQAAQRELERLDTASLLKNAYEALAMADPLQRPMVFAEHFDRSVAEETLRAFEAAVPATPEALVYGGTGMLIALLFLAGSEALGRGVTRRVRGHAAQ